jgi:hypothetical protein
MEIEVRGERKQNKCYFKVKDVSKKFEMENLNSSLLHKDDNNYEIKLHYKYFTINKMGINYNINGKTSIKKYLFLTYAGMVKVLFSSRSGIADKFQSWATEKLFTIQLGEKKDKQKLAGELIGINYKTIKNVFETNSSKTPCVYLFLIGNVNELLEGKYNKDDLLCKYGCTDDLIRRTNEHDKSFMKEFNINVELLCFSIIEQQFKFNAETNISTYFNSNKIKYENYKELIIINKKDLHSIKEHYKLIQNSYIGCFKELNDKIIELEKQLIQEKHNIELLKEKHKNELKDKDIELKNKDIEVLQYKIKLLELNN